MWNPHAIWLQVVLISGLSLVGYVAAKLVGTARSVGLAGLFGDLVSSTAVTLAYSRRSRIAPVLGLVLAAGVLLASAVMVPASSSSSAWSRPNWSRPPYRRW